MGLQLERRHNYLLTLRGVFVPRLWAGQGVTSGSLVRISVVLSTAHCLYKFKSCLFLKLKDWKPKTVLNCKTVCCEQELQDGNVSSGRATRSAHLIGHKKLELPHLLERQRSEIH
jgi:hypothetical protein